MTFGQIWLVRRQGLSWLRVRRWQNLCFLKIEKSSRIKASSAFWLKIAAKNSWQKFPPIRLSTIASIYFQILKPPRAILSVAGKTIWIEKEWFSLFDLRGSPEHGRTRVYRIGSLPAVAGFSIFTPSQENIFSQTLLCRLNLPAWSQGAFFAPFLRGRLGKCSKIDQRLLSL